MSLNLEKRPAGNVSESLHFPQRRCGKCLRIRDTSRSGKREFSLIHTHFPQRRRCGKSLSDSETFLAAPLRGVKRREVSLIQRNFPQRRKKFPPVACGPISPCCMWVCASSPSRAWLRSDTMSARASRDVQMLQAQGGQKARRRASSAGTGARCTTSSRTPSSESAPSRTCVCRGTRGPAPSPTLPTPSSRTARVC